MISFLLVMILIMSINFYVCLAVAYGQTFGFLIFNSKDIIESKKKCHWKIKEVYW